jgi:hypothetical protein
VTIVGYLKTADWLAADFRPKPEIDYLVQQWAATFRISWPSFRHEVAQIAGRLRSKVRGIEWRDPQPGDLVLPIDDDDWLHPRAAEYVAYHAAEIPAPTIDCWHWQGWALRETGLAKNDTPFLVHCNYAFIDRPGREQWRQFHGAADRGYQMQPVVGRINAGPILQIWNCTPGSVISLLYKIVRPNRFGEVLEKAIATHQRLRDNPPDSIPWAREAIDQQLDLLRRL